MASCFPQTVGYKQRNFGAIEPPLRVPKPFVTAMAKTAE